MIKTLRIRLLFVCMAIVSCATAQKINSSTIPFDFNRRFALNVTAGSVPLRVTTATLKAAGDDSAASPLNK